MTETSRTITVDIGAAAAALEASPELCAMMNQMVGGPALVEAQSEIDRLRGALQGVIDWWNSLPPNLRQDIEGSGAEPGVIAIARRTAKGK